MYRFSGNISQSKSLNLDISQVAINEKKLTTICVKEEKKVDQGKISNSYIYNEWGICLFA